MSKHKNNREVKELVQSPKPHYVLSIPKTRFGKILKVKEVLTNKDKSANQSSFLAKLTYAFRGDVDRDVSLNDWVSNHSDNELLSIIMTNNSDIADVIGSFIDSFADNQKVDSKEPNVSVKSDSDSWLSSIL